MFGKLKRWWNRKEIAEDLERKLREKAKQRIAEERASAYAKLLKKKAELERKLRLRFSQAEIDALKEQASLTGRPILLDLILVLERRLKDARFKKKHEAYYLKLEQLLDLIGRKD